MSAKYWNGQNWVRRKCDKFHQMEVKNDWVTWSAYSYIYIYIYHYTWVKYSYQTFNKQSDTLRMQQIFYYSNNFEYSVHFDAHLLMVRRRRWKMHIITHTSDDWKYLFGEFKILSLHKYALNSMARHTDIQVSASSTRPIHTDIDTLHIIRFSLIWLFIRIEIRYLR